MSTREIYFRCELLSSDYSIKNPDIKMKPGGTVGINASAAIKRTARFSIEDDAIIAWESDLFRLWCVIDGIPTSLGIFIPASPSKQNNIRTVQGYGQANVLNDDKVAEYLYFASGQPYTECVSDIINGAGLTRISIDASPEKLLTDREFEIGKGKLEIANTLLSEMNFEQLYDDADGVMTARRYVNINERAINHTYAVGKYSVIRPGLISQIDFFNMPNVFVGIVSNPEIGDMRAVYTNDDPNSLTSTIRRGRKITDVHKFDVVPSQGILEGLVERRAIELSQILEEVEFETAIMPSHGVNDIIELEHPQIGQQRYIETQWTIQMQAGAPMKHKARRILL